MLPLSLILLVVIHWVLCSARRVKGKVENHVGRFANPHRKALTSTPWGYSRFTLESIHPSDTIITTTVGPTTPADEEQHREDDDDDDDGGEWENSSSTSATTATSTIASSTQSITTLTTTTDPSLATPSSTTSNASTDPSLATPSSTTSNASVETSTESPTHVVLATSQPSASLATSPPTYFASTVWILTSTTEHPTNNNWPLTYAPISHFPTHSPTPAVVVTSSPSKFVPTYFPTYSPTYSPTLFPQTSYPTTIEPTPFPSQDLIVSVSESIPTFFQMYRTKLLTSIHASIVLE
jgi:hypothetical protein